MAATKYSTGAPGQPDYNVLDVQPAGNGYGIGYANVSGAPNYDDAPYGDNGNTALPASQGKNAISGGNGNVLIDSNNDAIGPVVNRAATVQGNSAYGAGVAQSPTQNVPMVGQSAQVVLNTQMIRLVWKNPA